MSYYYYLTHEEIEACKSGVIHLITSHCLAGNITLYTDIYGLCFNKRTTHFVLLGLINSAIQVSDATSARSYTCPKSYTCSKDLIKCIEAVEDVLTEDLVYDTYPRFVVKLNEIFARDDLTQQTMCKVLGGISNPTLTKFLSIKCIQIVGNKMYKLASYVFLRS